MINATATMPAQNLVIAVMNSIPDTEYWEYVMSWESFVCRPCADGKHQECKGVGWCDCQHRT